MMRRGANGARKAKKEKRMRMEHQSVTSQLVNLARAHGFSVNDHKDLPRIFQEILASATPRPSAPPPLEPDQFFFMADQPAELAFPDDPDEIHANAFAEIKDTVTQPIAHEAPVISDEFIEIYESKNQEMIERVTTQGIQYKGNPGPSAGKRLAPHPSASKVMPGLALPDDPELPTITGPAETEESQEDNQTPADGRRNPKTGMSLEEQRKIIERVTGVRPKAPKAGPPNTLKP